MGPRFQLLPSPPIVDPTSKTTVFHAHFSSTSNEAHPDHVRDRTLKRVAVRDRTLKRVVECDLIRPGDLPGHRYGFGMAVGVGGEILPEALEKMVVEICVVVFVDVQGLIRKFDKNDGTVILVKLKETKFSQLVPKIGVLKASAEEAEFIDVEEVRKVCCVVVTDGEDGCRVYWKDGEVKIAVFSTVQVDPTGAGDSLLGVFVAGLFYGSAVPAAALLGNFFGSLTVEQIGLPKFDSKLLQRVRDEVPKRALQCTEHRVGDEMKLRFSKPPGHDKFRTSLNSATKSYTFSAQKNECGLPDLHDHVSRPTNPCINHLCNGQEVLHDPVYDEPIQSVEGTP